MTERMEKALEAIKIIQKGQDIRAQRELAQQRHGLQKAEFEVLLNRNNATGEEIEAGRTKLIELYSQYIDAVLGLRQYSLDSQKQLEQMIGDNS